MDETRNLVLIHSAKLAQPFKFTCILFDPFFLDSGGEPPLPNKYLNSLPKKKS